MKRRRDELLVGLVLAVAAVLGFGGTIWIARGGLDTTYAMYSRFPWGAGLKRGQGVLLAGVQIGFVEDVALDPNGTLVVTMKIQDRYRVPKGSTATVEPNGIFGDQLIAVKPVVGVREFLSENDSIPAGRNPPGVSGLLSKGDSVIVDVKALTTSARSEFVDSAGLRDARLMIRDLSRLLSQIGGVAAEQSAQLTKTQAILRSTLASIDSLKVDSTLTNTRAISANLERLSDELRATNVEVKGLVGKASTGPGTVGRLMNDPALYARMDTLMLRVDSLIIDFTKNPRKFINLKIF
jgi:phospholipid/cholesterol/gamma-HCH transport system substrate-binding protein